MVISRFLLRASEPAGVTGSLPAGDCGEPGRPGASPAGSRRHVGELGFSLVELIGVMAIMAIVASAIVPNLIRQIDAAEGDAEQTSLKRLAEALTNQVVETKSVPSSTAAQWVAFIALSADVSPQQIRENRRGFKRRYYVDPKFLSSRNRRFKGYTQDVGLGTPPPSPRIMLVSNLKGNLPATLKTNAEFSAVWDQTDKARLTESGELVIQRINLRSHFHRVVLTNEHTSQPGYRLEAGKVRSLPAASGVSDGEVTRYMLTATRLELISAPFTGGNLEHVALIKDDLSFLYADASGDYNWVSQ